MTSVTNQAYCVRLKMNICNKKCTKTRKTNTPYFLKMCLLTDIERLFICKKAMLACHRFPHLCALVFRLRLNAPYKTSKVTAMHPTKLVT